MRQLFVIGLPITGAMALEWGLFSSAAILMGWISTVALAAHQIALQIAAVIFMVPFGISMAATVRVGHAVGRRDPVATRRAGFAAMGLGTALLMIITVAIVVCRHLIPLVFLSNNSAVDAQTIALSALLLLIGATWFISYALQGIAAGALRGLNDTRVPMIYAAVSFWLVGFSAGYALAFWAQLGAIGIWIGFALSLTLYAALLLRRFDRLTARGYLPSPA
jgi:MATE family multidrug resistance protein